MTSDQLFSAALTSLLAVAVFVAGQIIIKFFVEPMQKQSEVIGEIAHSLNYYANVFGLEPANMSPALLEHVNTAKVTYRDQASRLRATTATIKWYGLWAFFLIIPKHADIAKASSNLIGLSNSVFDAHINWESLHQRQEEIKKALRLRF